MRVALGGWANQAGNTPNMLAEATKTSSTLGTVMAALHQASSATGEDFQYLLGTAMRESGLKPQAKSSTSSATGLFQFVDQTWLGLVKQTGGKYGLGSYASRITQNADGHYSVDSQSDRQAILALRNDPRVSALMEGEYANKARASLESSLGRDVCNGELYAAHFLGPEAACKLIRMSETQPDANAAAAFPQAAGANRKVFYHADGTAKSVGEVYNWAIKQPAVAAASVSPSETAPKLPTRVTTPAQQDGIEANDGWTAMQLLSATEGATPFFGLSGLPQSPFAVTPGVVDLLGTYAPANSNAHSRARAGA